MKKKMKLSLDDIKVKSFITSLKDDEVKLILGGDDTTGDVGPTRAIETDTSICCCNPGTSVTPCTDAGGKPPQPSCCYY